MRCKKCRLIYRTTHDAMLYEHVCANIERPSRRKRSRLWPDCTCLMCTPGVVETRDSHFHRSPLNIPLVALSNDWLNKKPEEWPSHTVLYLVKDLTGKLLEAKLICERCRQPRTDGCQRIVYDYQDIVTTLLTPSAAHNRRVRMGHRRILGPVVLRARGTASGRLTAGSQVGEAVRRGAASARFTRPNPVPPNSGVEASMAAVRPGARWFVPEQVTVRYDGDTVTWIEPSSTPPPTPPRAMRAPYGSRSSAEDVVGRRVEPPTVDDVAQWARTLWPRVDGTD